MKQSIKSKILAVFLTIVAVLTISEAFIFAMHFVIVKRYEKIIDNLVSEYDLIGSTSNLVNSFYDLIQYANDQQRMDAFNNNLADLQVLLDKLDKNIADSASWTVYLGVKSTVNGVVAETKSGVAAVLAGKISEVTGYYLGASQKNNFVKDNTANLLIKELGYAQEARANIVKIKTWSEIIGLLLFLIVILFSLWYSYYFSGKLSSRLFKLAKLAKENGSERLSADLEKSLKEGNDEVADLFNLFRTMSSSSRDNIKKLNECNSQLTKTKKIVSDKELLISELSKENRLKDEFANVVIQKIKTSLLPILSLSETLDRKKEVLPQEYQEYIENIHNERIILNDLMRQILQAVNDRNDKTTIAKERFNLDELIMSMETSLNILAKRTSSKIVLSLQDRGVGMNSNKENISQVIYNFVDNAVEHGPNGQTIAVTMMRSGSKAVRVEVSDEGSGIPKEFQDKLFLKFYQPGQPAASLYEGMGLGLYICKRNVEILGGEIDVTSGEKKGSIFYFTIPLIAGDGKKEEVYHE